MEIVSGHIALKLAGRASSSPRQYSTASGIWNHSSSPGNAAATSLTEGSIPLSTLQTPSSESSPSKERSERLGQYIYAPWRKRVKPVVRSVAISRRRATSLSHWVHFIALFPNCSARALFTLLLISPVVCSFKTLVTLFRFLYLYCTYQFKSVRCSGRPGGLIYMAHSVLNQWGQRHSLPF